MNAPSLRPWRRCLTYWLSLPEPGTQFILHPLHKNAVGHVVRRFRRAGRISELDPRVRLRRRLLALRKRGHVNLGASRHRYQIAYVIEPDTAAREHLDSSRRTLYQLPNECTAFGRAAAPPAGEDPRNAKVNQLFQS